MLWKDPSKRARDYAHGTWISINIRGHGGVGKVKKDNLKKVAQLKGIKPSGEIEDQDMLKACQDARKVLSMKTVDFDKMLSCMSDVEVNDVLDFCIHKKTNSDKKLSMLHEFSSECRNIQKGIGHLEFAIDHTKEMVQNAIILKFTRVDGDLKMQDIIQELEVIYRIKKQLPSHGSESMIIQ